jgi:hypothetical protein
LSLDEEICLARQQPARAPLHDQVLETPFGSRRRRPQRAPIIARRRRGGGTETASANDVEGDEPDLRQSPTRSKCCFARMTDRRRAPCASLGADESRGSQSESKSGSARKGSIRPSIDRLAGGEDRGVFRTRDRPQEAAVQQSGEALAKQHSPA